MKSFFKDDDNPLCKIGLTQTWPIVEFDSLAEFFFKSFLAWMLDVCVWQMVGDPSCHFTLLFGIPPGCFKTRIQFKVNAEFIPERNCTWLINNLIFIPVLNNYKVNNIKYVVLLLSKILYSLLSLSFKKVFIKL